MLKNTALKKLLKYLSKYRNKILLSALFALLSAICTIYSPILIGRIIDELTAVRKVDLAAVFDLILTILLLSVCTTVSQWLMTAINNSVVFDVVRNWRQEVFEHLQHLPLSYLDSHSYGETVNKVINDIDSCADGLLLGFSQLFTGVLTISGTLLFMFYLNWRVAMIVVLLTPLTLLATRFIANRTHSLFSQQSALRAEQTAYIQEMVDNEKIVQAFSQQEISQADFDKTNQELTKISLKAIFFSSLTNPATRLINGSIYAVIGFFSARNVISGLMTVGSLSSFLSYANQFSRPFNEISGVISELQNSIACGARVFELLEQAEEEAEPLRPFVFESVKGDVNLRDVDFSYVENVDFIKNMNLHLKQGQRVALVGPTGCGKTTVINLLMRFYDPSSGQITVDGTDISKASRASLRRQYGMILQDTWLKQGSIRDNIVLAKPEATDQEVIEAAKKAHAHNFIMRLPNGYDSQIAEDGGSLSQGQKQLLCISRLMLALPPILILDEATSSIDTRTELKIQDSFSRLMKGKTSFIVAHRLSTIREADMILVMKSGRIIEQGNHEQLLKEKGFYSQLYNSQFEN